MNRAWLVAIAMLLPLMGGCAWLKSAGTKDNVEPPAELMPIDGALQVQRIWTSSVGSGAGSSGALMGVTVVDGRAYAASVDGTVRAFDAATGRTLWTTRLGEGKSNRRRDHGARLSSKPGVEGDLLVIGSLDGRVFALSSADGSHLWTVTVSSEILAQPAISGGFVAVRANDGRLYGLDSADGSRRWIYDQPVPPLTLRGSSAPQISGGIIYSGFDNGVITALQLANGEPVWSQLIALGEGRTEVERLADVDGRIVVDGDTVFGVGYGGKLAALTSYDGRPQWQRDLSSYSGVAVNPSVVAVVDDEASVWLFERTSGSNLWKQDDLSWRWLSAPALVTDHAVVGDLDGYVHWLSLEDGRVVARTRLGRKPIEVAPIAVGDTVYVVDIGGQIGAYRVAR